MAMPQGISTTSQQLPNGKSYEFSHRRLGKLGRLIITAMGNQSLCSAEIAPGEITDPQWQERFDMFSQVVQTCMDALPGKNQPMPDMEETKRKVNLYRRFIATKDSIEMEKFAKSITDEEYATLLDMIGDAQDISLTMQDTGDLIGTAQRYTELLRLRG